MLTGLTVRNFKRFRDVEIELGNPVVFIGPNNSGKTSAMQALALWDVGLKRWNEKRAGKTTPERRPGVTVSRRDLAAVPVPNAALLWRGRHTRDTRVEDGRRGTRNVLIEIVVEGVTAGKAWTCGLEFDHANEESFYCRPLRTDAKGTGRMPVPPEAGGVRIAVLPPMSELAATETRLDDGAVNVRVGEGRTAGVLRNLCLRVHDRDPGRWDALARRIETLFGAALGAPRYVAERGEIEMDYREGGARLDLSSSGRGLQQTLLILAYMDANPGAVILLDEPDAHLEILRQRQIYELLTEAARTSGSQIVAASHSEVVLTEAAGKDTVIAFVGRPHRIDDRGSQLRKALTEIGWEDYVQAEQTGWVLYLEGATDLAVLRAFAERLGHEAAARCLERPFVRYVGNRPSRAERHFAGLKEALPQLAGVALFDRLDAGPPTSGQVRCLAWKKREIENYLCTPAALEAWARASGEEPMPLFERAEAETRLEAMRQSVAEVEDAMRTLGKGGPWDADTKVSDEFLAPLFEKYFGKLGLPNLMRKTSFHALAGHVRESGMDPEIGEKLDAIADAAAQARPEPLP